jgi:hypothetical protein
LSTIADILPLVERVAKRVHFMYGLDTDEATGILSLEVVEYQTDYLTLHTEGQIRIIEMRLKNVAARHARADRVRRMVENAQADYDPKYVRLFLPFFFDREDWPNGPADDLCGEWTTGDAIDTALDIKRAWPQLHDWQSRVITARHMSAPTVNGQTDWDGIAESTGHHNGHTARTKYSQATLALAVEMNATKAHRCDNHDGPGARRAVSNAKAAAIVSQQTA